MVDQTQNVLDAFTSSRKLKKQNEIAGFLGKISQGGEGAEQARVGLAGLGPEGVSALGGLQSVEDQQQAIKQSQQAAAMQGFQQNALFALAGDDAELERATPFLARMAQGGGITDEVIQGIVKMPVAKRRQAIQKALGISRAQEKGDFILVDAVHPETGKPVKARFDKNTGEMSLVKGFEVAGKAAPTGGLETVTMPDGSKRSFDVTKSDQRKEYLAAKEAGAIDDPTRQVVGKPEDFSTDKIADEMANIEASTRNFIADIGEAQDFVKENPAALTTVSGLARVATNISANIDTLRQDFDVEFEEGVLDAESYLDTFKELGIENAEMQSIMIGLASQQAIINNPSGRVSDRDLKTAMQQIGSSIQNAEGFIRVTDRLASRADRVFRNQYKSRSKDKKDFEGDLGLVEEAVIEGAEELRTISDESSYDALPSGTEFIGPDGKRYKKP
ncbi:MAG: hypothetical protein V3T23_09320 [Nitrososphaerales archaeon]